MKAVWNGVTIAESKETVVVEGNHYFPMSAIHQDYLRPNDTHTTCPWKGVASYYSIDVKGDLNPDAAWYYPDPKPEAEKIRDHLPFGMGWKSSNKS